VTALSNACKLYRLKICHILADISSLFEPNDLKHVCRMFLQSQHIALQKFRIWHDQILSIRQFWKKCRIPSDFKFVTRLLQTVNGNMLTAWFIVCCWTYSQTSDLVRPYLCRFATHRPWPAESNLAKTICNEVGQNLLDNRVGYNSVDKNKKNDNQSFNSGTSTQSTSEQP